MTTRDKGITLPYVLSSISVKDRAYGAVGDGVTDDTVAIQAAITAAITSNVIVEIPPGIYKITSSLNLSATTKIRGAGSGKVTLNFTTASSSTFAFILSLPDNSSSVGFELSGFRLNCDKGAAQGSGIYMTTTLTNSAITQAYLHDIRIFNPSTGVSLGGVIYMSDFEDIVVTTDSPKAITNYGWYVVSAINQILYNSFSNLEVTGTGSTAWSYYVTAYASQFRNLTCDGCSTFSGPYSNMNGYSCESIYAAATPSNSCIVLNQFQSFNDVAIINVPNSKCSIGINVSGGSTTLRNIRTPDSGAGNQPNSLLYLNAGSSGHVIGVKCDRAIVSKLESYHSNAILNPWVFTSCSDITTRGLSYEETVISGLTFTGWTTNPTLIGALATKIGNQVTITIYAQDGVCTAGASINGLGFTCRTGYSAAVAGGCSDTTKRLAGTIASGTSAITNIPANILTGTFWQLTVTFPV